MRFEKIEITNFRGYYGENNILEFSKDPKKPLTMIVGDNGGGKSSLMQAIQWCLYGDNIKDIRHNEAEGSAEVALTFSHNKKIYRALRKTADDRTQGLIMHELEKDGRQVKPIQEAQLVVNNILPKALKNWFLYDAEGGADRADTMDMLDLDGGPETKKALRRIQGFTKMDTLISDLEKIINSKKRLQVQQGTNKEAKEIQKKIDEFEEEINPLIKSRDSAAVSAEDLKKRITENNKKLLKLPKTEPIKRELEKLQPALKNLKEDQKAKENEFNKFEATFLPIFLLKNAINKNQRPEQIKEGMVIVHEPDNTNLRDKIIKDGKCICGREVTPQSKEEKAIEATLLDKSKNKEVNSFNQRASRVTNVLAIIEQKRDEYEIERDKLKKDLDGYAMLIKKHEDRIQELNDELNRIGNADDEVKKLTSLIKEQDTQKDNFLSTEAREDEKIRSKRDAQKRLGVELQEIKETGAKSKTLELLINKVSSLREYAYKKQKHDEEKALRTLSIELNEAIKKSSYKNNQIKIDKETYAIHVYDEITEEEKPALNGGEQELIKICLIACVVGQSAKQTLAKNNYLAQPTAAPVVIDAPFTKMDKNYISSCLDLLLEKAEQLILLSLPTDFKKYEADALGKIGKKYVVIGADKGARGKKKTSTHTLYGKKVDLVTYDNKNTDGEPISQSLIVEV